MISFYVVPYAPCYMCMDVISFLKILIFFTRLLQNQEHIVGFLVRQKSVLGQHKSFVAAREGKGIVKWGNDGSPNIDQRRTTQYIHVTSE